MSTQKTLDTNILELLRRMVKNREDSHNLAHMDEYFGLMFQDLCNLVMDKMSR